MPVKVHGDIRPMTQEEFGHTAYRVVDCAFAVHKEMGRFMSEAIYRNAIAHRLGGAQTEVPVVLEFEDFSKTYFVDLLVDNGGLFELKTVKTLGTRHRSQLLNYLFLTRLSHGKLINFRGESVEHEFVNTQLTHADRRSFTVAFRNWKETSRRPEPLAPWVVRLLRDLGTGLDIAMYESAVTHFLGGEDVVIKPIEIQDRARSVGKQKVRLANSASAIKVTSLDGDGFERFEDHARRFLTHTSLQAMQWINIRGDLVTFTTLPK